MKNFEENLLTWLFATMVAVGIFYPIFSDAQNVQQKGKTFVQQSSKRTVEVSVPSGYTYQDATGKQFPIYISPNGKAYIIKVCQSGKNKGKTYRKYLPKVTKKLQNKEN